MAIELSDSILFLRPKPDMNLCVQLEIELKEFKRFKHPYKTDKYLSIIQWEEIENRLKKVVKKKLKLERNNGMEVTAPGSFNTADGLTVAYRYLPKEESFIDFTKLKFYYTLHWIMNVTITETPPLVDSQSQQSADNASDQTSSGKSSPEKKKTLAEYSPRHVNNVNPTNVGTYTPSPIKQIHKPDENSKPGSLHHELFGSDSDHSNALKIDTSYESEGARNSPVTPIMSQEPRPLSLQMSNEYVETDHVDKENVESAKLRENSAKRARIPGKYKYSSESETEKQDKFDDSFKPDKPRKHKKVKKSQSVPSDQPKIDTMMGKTPSKVTQRGKSHKAADPEPPTEKSKVEKAKHKEESILMKAVDKLGPEEIARLNEFVAKTREEEKQQKERKRQLRNLKMYDCNDLSNVDLKKFIAEFRPDIQRHFNSRDRAVQEYIPMMLTTSNVFTDKQISYICTEIEKTREVSERGSKEDILTDVILPEFILHVFSREMGQSREWAIDRLKTQEERLKLYGESNGF